MFFPTSFVDQVMRSFYEEKLKVMEMQVREREEQRTSLIFELRKHEKDSQHFQKVRKALEEKEASIADLKSVNVS